MSDKYNFKKDIKQIWCPGCGLFVIYATLLKLLADLGHSNKDTVIVSGIGCSGRLAGYFNVDSVHTTHGRALCVAEGIKLANPKLKVIVLSGDGDLLSIGGNHLMHTARRNTDITVICNFNEIYGMTGGQCSPGTPKGNRTVTSPGGSKYNPINAQGIITSNNNYFFARSAMYEPKQFAEIAKIALTRKGFSFVEMHTACITNYGKRLGYKNVPEMVAHMKENFNQQKDSEKLAQNELGFVQK